MDLSELETQNLLIQQLKDLVRQKDSEVEEKTRCLKEAESKIAKSRLQLKAKDAKLSHLKKTMNQSRASGSSHEGEHEPRSGDSTNIKSKLLFQQKKIEEKERTIEVQQQTLQEQEMKFDKLREEFHSRHEELCQRLQQVSSSQGIDVVELTDNTPHVKDLYSAIMAKDQKIAELMSQVDESTFKLNNITQELQRSEEERAILSEKYEGNENLIAKQSSRVSDLEELVQSMSDGYETETNTIEELQRQVAKLEMRLHDKEETVAVKEEQILQLKRENNASLDDMQETNHQHDQLMRSLKRKLHEQEEVLAGKEKVVVLLQSELTDRSIEMSGLQNTIQLLQESIRDNMKANNHPSTASMYSEDRTNNNSDDDDEMVDLNKSSWDDGEGINFKNKYDQLLVQKDLQTAENAELKEQIQELEQKSYGLEVQLRELNQQFNDEAGEWREKEMAYDVKLTSYSSEVLSSTADTVRAQEDMDARMKTILSQMNNQTKVLEDQTHCLEKSEAEVKRLKQTVSSYKTNNNQLQTELKEQKQQFEATTEDLRQHMVATEVRFNIQLREVERAKLLFQEYLDSSHHQLETLLIEEHFSREVDSLVSSGDCTQYSDQINHFKNQVNLLRSKSQERFEPGEEITPAISCLIDQASTRTTTLASTFDLSRMLIRYLRQERDQILSESKDLSERLSEKRSIEEQAEELRRTLEEREEKLKSQSEFIEKLKAERLAVDEKLRQLDERFREFASDSKKISCERESWIEEMKMTHERDIAEAHRDRSDLEARLKAVTHQREVMARERDMMEEKLRTVEKDNDDVMWRMDERLSKLEAELDAKVSEHESMVSEMQVKHEEMVEGLMCDLEAATNRLESEKDELLHRLKEATTHAEQLKRDSDKCNNEIKHLTSKNSEFEVRIEALTGSCLDRDHELKSAVEKRDAAEKVLVELRAHLSDSSQEIGRLQANIQHKSEDLLKAEKERDALAYKVGELERRNDEMTNDYWLESSDSRQSELLKQERDVAISRATDLQDAVDEHQSEVEKKLVETEDKLKTAKLQLQDKMNANGFDNDLQMFQDPSLMKGDSQKQQTIQFLQSQLEELAREQEYQTSEHMSIVGRMNENIERLTEEKEDLSTSLERQVESLNEIAKRYDEKESDCHRLIRVVDDLQHKLEEAKALREDNFVTSQKYTARLRHAEDRINEFEDKLQDSMEELMMTKDEKEKCERKIPVLNRNLEETRAENLMLLDELKRLRSSVKFLQQELESASEAAEQMGKRHRDEVQQLKSLLRERDEAASRLSGDLCEREQTISSLNQSCIERTRQYEQQEVKLIERNNKVLELEGSLREYESELVALSQHSNGAMEKAQFRAQDLAEYVNKLEERVQSSDAQKVVLEKQVENLCEKLAMNDQELADIRRSCEEKDADLRKKLFDSECSLDAQMRDLKELEEKKLHEVEEEKAKSQELQVKLDCQALEVSRLTSYLEDQIYESNDHHRKERTRLEDQVKSLKSELHDYEKTNAELKENLSISTQFTATLSTKVEELEKWEREYQEKNELCGNLQSSCDLLEERLQEASKRAREFEQRLIEVTSQLEEARARLEEREARVKSLFDELTRTNNEVRTLKDALCEESERQLNELNSMVEERLAERDNQIAATAERVNELCAVINMKDLNLLKVKEELQQVKRSSQDAIEAKSKELEHFQAANQHLHEEFDALKAESSRTETSLQQVVEELKSKVEEMTSSAEECSLNTSRLDEELNRTIHELHETRDNGERALQEKVATYEAQTAKRKKIMKALHIRFKEEKEKLEGELKAMREQRGVERDSELSALQRKVEESELLSTSLRDQLASLITSSQEELSSRDSMITQHQSQITHLTQQIEVVTASARDSSAAADEEHRRRVAALQEENSTVCRQLAALQEENSTVCRQLADARDESSQLRQQHDVIVSELEQLRNDQKIVVENLQQKSSETAEITSLRSQLSSLEDEKSASIQSLRDEIESLEEQAKQRNEMEERMASLSSELVETRSSLASSEEAMKAVGVELDEAKNRADSLQRQLNDQQGEHDEKFAEEKKNFAESQRKLKAALLSRKSLIGKMKELETKSKEKEDAASASIALLHHQVAELEASRGSESESVDALKNENSSLAEKNNELVAQITKLEEDIIASASAHENAVGNVEKELQALRQSAVELVEERGKLLEEKMASEEKLRNEMKILQEENEASKLSHINFVADAEKESCLLKEEISNLLGSQKKSQQLEDELNVKIATLEQQKSKLESELSARHHDYETMRCQFDETKKDLDEQVANLSKDLYESQENRQQLEKEIQEKVETHKREKEELESQHKKHEDIRQGQFDKLREEISTLLESQENHLDLEDDLKKKIRDLEQENNRLKSDLNDTGHQNYEGAAGESLKLSKSLDESQEDCRRLLEQLSLTRQEKCMLESDIERLESESAELQKLLDGANVEKDSMRSELEEKTERLQEATELKSQVESLNQQLEELQCDHESLQDSMKAKHAEMKSSLEANQAELESEFESELKESNEKNSELVAQIALLHHQVAELKTESESAGELRNEESSLAEKNNELVAQIAKLEEDRLTSASAHESAIESLEKQLETLRQSNGEREAVEERLQATLQLNNELTARMESLHEEKMRVDAVLKSSDEKQSELQAQLNSKDQLIEKFDVKITSLQQKLTDLHATQTELERQKSQLEAELSAQKEDYESMKCRFDQTTKELNDQVANLSKDLHESQESLERQKNQLESELGTRQEDSEESSLVDKNNELVAQIAKLEEDRLASASAHENAFKSLEKQLETLRQSNGEREAVEERLQATLQLNNELTARMESLQEEKMRVDAVLKSSDEKQSELQAQLNSTTQLLDDAVKNAAELQNERINLDERIADLQQTVLNSSVEEEKLQKSSTASENKIITLQRKLKAALVSRKELLKVKSQLEADLQLSKTETELARSEVSSLQDRNAALEQHNVELNRSCEEKSVLKAQMQALETTMGECREEKGQVEEELKRTQSQVKTLKEEVKTLETCNNDLNDITSALEAGKSKLERSLADKTEMLRSAQKCIRKLEKSTTQPPPPPSSSPSDGAVEVEKLRKHNEELMGTIKENEEQLEALSLQLEDAKSERENVESQLDALRHQTTVMTSPPEQIDPVVTNHHVECEDIEVQTNNDDIDDELEEQIKKARLELIEETLTQLKSTQPDMWEQEPGIKKLIDRMELAMTQSTKRQKELSKKEKELAEATANLTALQAKVGKVEDENARLCEENEKLPDLRKEVDESRKRVAAVLRDCDHLNTALQSEKDSYEQVHRRLERDNHMLREKMNHRLAAEQELNDQLNELKLKVADLEGEKNNLMQERVDLLSSKDRVVEIESAKEEVEKRLKTVEDENEELKLQVEKIEGNLVEKREEIEQQQRRQLDHDTAVTRLTDDVTRLTNRLRAATTDYDSAVALMTQEAKSRENEVAELNSLLAQKDAQLASIDEQISEKLNKEKEITAVVESSNIEFETLHGAELTEVTQVATGSNNNNEQLMLDKELKNREDLISRLLTDCVKFKSKLAAADSQRDSSQTRIDALFTQIKSLTALRIQYESNENHLKSELSEKDRVIERNSDELRELRQKRDKFLAVFSCSTLSQARKLVETERKEATRDQLKLELTVAKLEEEKQELIEKLSASVSNEDHHSQQFSNIMADLVRKSNIVDSYEGKLNEVGLMMADRHVIIDDADDADKYNWLFDAIKLRVQQANDLGNSVNVHQVQLGEAIQQRDAITQQLTQAAQALQRYQQQYNHLLGNYNTLHESYKSLQERNHDVEGQLLQHKNMAQNEHSQQDVAEPVDVQKMSLNRSGSIGDGLATEKDQSAAAAATLSEVEELYERIEKQVGEKSLLQERISQLEEKVTKLRREQKAEDWKLEIPMTSEDGEENEILLTNSSIVKTVRRSRGCVSKMIRMGRSNHRIKLFSLRTLAFVYMCALHFIAVKCIFV